ncbi:unnamed protein product [Gordionus sp. m RMFG-2023]
MSFTMTYRYDRANDRILVTEKKLDFTSGGGFIELERLLEPVNGILILSFDNKNISVPVSDFVLIRTHIVLKPYYTIKHNGTKVNLAQEKKN